MGFGNNFGWGMGYGWPIGIIVLVIVVILLVRLFSSSDKHHNIPSENNHPSSPMEILKRRYASGEISKEEFDSMARDLREK